MCGQAGDPCQALPVDVHTQGNLIRRGRSLLQASADITCEFGRGIDLHIDAAVFEPRADTAEIAQQVLDRRGNIGCGLRIEWQHDQWCAGAAVSRPRRCGQRCGRNEQQRQRGNAAHSGIACALGRVVCPLCNAASICRRLCAFVPATVCATDMRATRSKPASGKT